MLSRIVSPLQIDSDCCQVSCRFDKNFLQDETPGLLGVALPSILNGAVMKRKAEFIAGRYCARAALAQFGDYLDATIGFGANREPLWPQGFVGSITHTHGYASAVVARRNKVRAVGVDSEMWIEPGTLDNDSRQILTSSEDHADYLHLFESPLHYLTLVFSAKESLFKCLFPLVNKFFDFHAAVIVLDPSASATGGGFRFELVKDLNAEFRAGYSGHGRYSIRDGCVHTAVVLKAQGLD